MDFTGKTVLITGASSGIGAACAKLFSQHNARLILCARRIDRISELAQQLKREHGTDCHLLPLDVRDFSNVKQELASLPKVWQDIDVLVNNAGLAAGLEPLQTADVQDWEDMIDTNVKGLLYMTRLILPRMIERNTGHVINIGSIAGHQVYPKGSVYCATKHAVKAISQGLRQDVFGTDIRVSSVDPGAVETNFSLVRFKGDKAKADAVYAGMTPLAPENVADAVFYCASRPPHVNISEMIVMPTSQAAAMMTARKEAKPQ